MTRDDWYELHRPARPFDEDRPSLRYKAGIVRDGVIGFVAGFVFLFALLIAAGGTT